MQGSVGNRDATGTQVVILIIANTICIHPETIDTLLNTKVLHWPLGLWVIYLPLLGPPWYPQSLACDNLSLQQGQEEAEHL